MPKLLLRIAATLMVLVVGLVLAAWLAVRGSLPTLEGRRVVQGVAGAVTLERDALGALTVTGARRADVAFGLGYAHGQDRYFQMDLLRRAAAGELSALLGRGTLEVDRRLRVHRLRAVAHAAAASATPEQRDLLEAYAKGVNAGLGSLRVRPFEYLVLRTTPAPWTPEDSELVVLAMFLQLQEPDAHTKIQRGLVYSVLPRAAADFVYAAAPDWEATLDGTRSADPVVPSADAYDLRAVGALDVEAPVRHGRARTVTGSNNWAVAGSRTASGAALVANDMHLGFRVPNTWYRARLRIQAEGQAPVDLTGVSLPGAPSIVTGSNGRVAWAFTNSYGDYQDVVIAVPDPQSSGHYLTAEGSQPFTHVIEHIAVKGGASVDLDVVGTRWGPVIAHDEQGRPLALEWTAHDPAAVNPALAGLDQADGIEAALAIAATAGIPAQNFVVGDAAGHIAWTIAGQIPTRHPGDASVPRLSTDPAVGFTGWLSPDARPRIIDPAAGQLATANARVVGGANLAAIGDGGYDRGARAGQIQEDLRAHGDRQTPQDELDVQLDDRALFLARWQSLLAGLLDAEAVKAHPRRAELGATLARWTGRAAVEDPAYRLVRAFRMEVERQVFYALVAPARARSPGFRFQVPGSFEGPLWALVAARPVHLLPPGHADWRAFLLSAVDQTLAGVDADCPTLAGGTWGQVNFLNIRHPLSAALPVLAGLLDMPREMLPGDEDMPRVQGVAFGASERFAVSPGHEAEAYFEMPGGQSGHPLSPYFRAGHEAWAHGRPAPFLPGVPEHVLTLTP